MSAKKVNSNRKRSRPVEKKSKLDTFKKNKLVFGVLIIVIVVVIAGGYVLLQPKGTGPLLNAEPLLTEDFAVITMNAQTFEIDALANDIDESNLTIISIESPENGVAKVENNRIVYTPETNFSGVDYISYTVGDGEHEVSSKVHVVIADQNPIALIDTSMGIIVVELFEDKASDTCENFIKLANDGFYDGLVFHRVMDDFMIQGGGFETDGTQKTSPYGTIDLEINAEVRHVDGAIAMARTNDPNSATSQFYICDGAQSFLDDNYAAFGVTIDGIEVVREIAALDPEHTTTKYEMQNWPTDDVIINSITIENQ